MNIIVIPCLYDNYSYLIVNDGQAAVVDPSEAWPVMKEVERQNVSLTAVLCTHHHHDHIGGVADLLDEYDDLAVYGFRQDKKRIPAITRPLSDNDQIAVCGLDIDVMHTPGHTSTHIIYRLDDHLFVGDTLFGAGCGRLFEGTPEQMVGSLDRISACPTDSRIYFGHEYTELNLRFSSEVDPANAAVRERAARVAELRSRDLPSTPSTVADELATNPFLRAEDSSIIEKLKSEGRITGSDRVTVFAALRELRNHFS
jgi:hydroxyacylglutathione hydrolase